MATKKDFIGTVTSVFLNVTDLAAKELQNIILADDSDAFKSSNATLVIIVLEIGIP